MLNKDKNKKVAESVNALHNTSGIKTVLTIVEYSNGHITAQGSKHASLTTIYGLLKIVEAKIRLQSFEIWESPKQEKI